MADPLPEIDADGILAIGRRVIGTEAAALALLADSLGGAFVRGVDLLLAARGRVIVSGMGKSGHIARKIAATLASTGAPSFFVHPAEASHGDLGMITPADVVMLLSNSGETAELADLIAYTRRFAIPLIGVVPEDEGILVSSNRGAPAALDDKNRAGQAYRDIARRLLGQDVPFMALEEKSGFLQRIGALFGAR